MDEAGVEEMNVKWVNTLNEFSYNYFDIIIN